MARAVTRIRATAALLLVAFASTATIFAQVSSPGRIVGTARDTTGGTLAGVTVELRRQDAGVAAVTQTDRAGRYQFDAVQAGDFDVVFSLLNFASLVRHDVRSHSGQTITLDVVLQLTLSADVTVTGRRTFTNLADIDNPEENLIGIANAASEGAVTARQLENRPVMRAGEVLETVPGLIISQHSGEGKANQYYLRGFNLDHGTDFSTSIAGIPVNMPTHAHGHGYTDANFLIPELVSGVQFKKGPYYADEGDFSAAGSVNVNYVSVLDAPIVSLSAGAQGWNRLFGAASPKLGRGHLLGAIELNHHDGPWTLGDDYRKVNGVVRYSQGTATHGFALSGMFYRGEWNSTDQVPRRAIESGAVPRFGHIDATNGGSTHRYSLSGDAQWANANSVTRANAFFVDYALNLFSNFTYFLDDPVRGDQFEQVDRRKITGGRLTHRRMGRMRDRPMEHLIGVHVRRDDIGTIGLYRTQARNRFATTREDRVDQTSVGLFAQSEYQWSRVLRTTLGLRGDVYRFDVRGDRGATRGIASPKLSAGTGSMEWNRAVRECRPWLSQQRCARRAGSMTARSARARARRRNRAADGQDPAACKARCRCGSWPSIPSWCSWATLAPPRPAGRAAGSALNGRHTRARVRGCRSTEMWLCRVRSLPTSIQPAIGFLARSSRWCRWASRFTTSNAFPAAYAFDSSARGHWSKTTACARVATSLLNGQISYRLRPHSRLVVEMFNLLNETASDIDYFYTSRLPGEPSGGIDDVHTHPALPRAVRVCLQIGF